MKRIALILVPMMALLFAGCPVIGTGGGGQGPSDSPSPEIGDSTSCGDGVLGELEECDDSNTFNGDNCSSTCMFESVDRSPVPWSINLHPEDISEYAAKSGALSLVTSLERIRGVGATMVRIDIPWMDIQPKEGSITDDNWCYTNTSNDKCETAGIDFFRNILLPALRDASNPPRLTPIVVLSRPPEWALNHYRNGNKELYWQEWQRYCRKLALMFGSDVYYYQMGNEANAGVDVASLVRVGDQISDEDDARQFTECRAGIARFDSSFETIVNVYANAPFDDWEADLDHWLGEAGGSIDIIAIDHYPGTWTFTNAEDWAPLDSLFRQMSLYGKKGAIAETGYATHSSAIATEEGQRQWVLTALPIIKQKLSGRTDIVFANFYELFDSGDWDFIRPQEGHFGLLHTDGTPKPAYDALKKQIIGTSGDISSLSAQCPPYGDRGDIDADGLPNVCDNDSDGDGIADTQDNCPLVANTNQEDADGDGRGDACKVGDESEDLVDTDGDGVGDDSDTDDDNDGYSDAVEIAAGTDPANKYATPEDRDKDGTPDSLDSDDDNDGVADSNDAFPQNPNEWTDTDGDGIGDNADLDDDNDGYTDAVEIQLGSNPLDANSSPADHDKDGIPDALDPDDDNDGIADDKDAFPFDSVESLDTDNDGIGDATDPDDDNDCYADTVELSLGTNPRDAASKPPDMDHDCNPDALDSDDDGDGIADGQDAFPSDPNEWMDTDGDGVGNNADADDDNDCYQDSVELAAGSDPLNPGSKPPDADNDCTPNSVDGDDDGDGVADGQDAFPLNPSEWLDSDNDGTGNNADADDDNDGMPDSWELAYQLNPLNAQDAGMDFDEDKYSNLAEYRNGTNPRQYCSPPSLQLCYEFGGDSGQCGGATGIKCVSLESWSPSMFIDTDNRAGNCYQKFMIQSQCQANLTLCVDFEGDSPGADMGQCQAAGLHCAPINQWTSAITLDMDNRNGWCTQRFSISGDGGYFLDVDLSGDAGQCKPIATTTASSSSNTPTNLIGLDTDDRAGGCYEKIRLRRNY